MIKLKTTFQDQSGLLYKEEDHCNIEQATLYYFNTALAKSLHLNADKPMNVITQLFQQPHRPIAQAYAGHQFGHFSQLGDGRAILLGEYSYLNDQLMDVHIKGSGPTAYSRRGDGKATLSAMLREVIYSEALAGLHIPTTRSLAILTTGELISRQTLEPAALLVRLASSHIRVGTFEYVATLDNISILEQLIDYSIQRHYPDIEITENRAGAFLQAVIKAQAKLIAKWLQVGFIHGVMNTDNMTVSGETLDFGPCAFINRYDPQACFSSIDHNKRYAFEEQINIAKWNLCRLAEALLPMLDKNTDQAIEKAQTFISEFDIQFNGDWQSVLCQKIGFEESNNEINNHAQNLLQLMHDHQLDYHNTFYNLTYDDVNPQLTPLQNWLEGRQRLLASHGLTTLKAKNIMRKVNPVVIPRNHIVENAIASAVNQQDNILINKLLEDLRFPFKPATGNTDFDYYDVPIGHDEHYQTYCGT